MNFNQQQPASQQPKQTAFDARPKLDVSLCLEEAWRAFKVNPGLAIGGFLLWYAIYFVAVLIPILNLLMIILVLPPMLLGQSLFSLNLAGRGQPGINDLWAGFHYYGKAMGIYWLGALAVIIVMTPWIIAVMAMGMISPTGEPDPSQLTGMLGMYVLIMVIVVWLEIRFAWAFFIAVDEPNRGVIDCFKRSWQITRGNTGRLFLLVLLALLVMIAGILLLVVGVFAALPVVGLMTARAYLWLKSFHPEPVETTAPAPDGSV